jgi:hypothetical protein
MKNAWVFLILAAVGASVLAPAQTYAVVKQLSFEELVTKSPTVVRGQVLAAVPHWDEAHSVIYTTVTVRADDYIVGAPEGDTISFEVPGGTVGEISLAVSDVPDFAVGEDVVLFLRDKYFRLVGCYQGKYTVKDEVVQERGVPYSEFRERILSVPMFEEESMQPDIREVRAVLNPDLLPDIREPVLAEDKAVMGTETIMTEGFEGTFPTGSWSVVDQSTTDGGEYLWGKDDYDKYAGTYSMWCAAAGADALDPEFDNYVNNMDTWAIYGPFDLSDAYDAELRFMRRTMNADTGDRLSWLASHDGVNFSGYQGFGFVGWTLTTLDLTNVGGDNMTGDDSVWIAFRFTSSASGTNKGPWIDEVVLEKNVGPTVDSITPDTGPSGTGFSVTITGFNFGATQGSSEVRFPRNVSEGLYVYADVVTSWSDTEIVCEVPERASSGIVTVVVDGNPGLGKHFTVTFAASSTWWQNSEPMGEDFRINENTPDVDTELESVVKGMQEWNTEGEAFFSFTYGGATSATGESYNGVNEICWGAMGDPDWLGVCWTWYSGSSILENDIVFNSDHTWSALSIRRVATHELGHCLRLLDLYGSADSGKTMYGYSQAGEETIEAEDIAGIQYFYGLTTVNITSRLLPNAEEGTPYSETLVATGGATPYSWAMRGSPALPPGLSLSSDGVISGTPTTPGVYCFNVRVTDDDSDKDSQVFFIEVNEDVTGPDVTVVSPNGGETCPEGAAQDITWTATDYSGVDSVSIYYSVNGGADYDLVSSGETNDGLYPWTVPGTLTDSALVRIIAYDGLENSAEDVSDGFFSIADTTRPAVTVLAPNGGETWYIGNDEDITWTATDANGVDSVSILYSVNDGGAYDLIASGEPNDGVYPWTVPDTPTDSALVKIIAYDPSLNTGEDVSDARFTIAAAPDTTDPDVTVLKPNGGETWYGNDNEDITWTATDANGVDSVSILYSLDGGGAYHPIASGEDNDGVYTWLIPDTFSVTALVKVIAYDPSLNTGEDESDAVFTIADDTGPIVDVLTPDGGEYVVVWDDYDITWTAADPSGVDSVSVFYSVNGGDTYELIASQEPDDGTYSWSVPNTVSDSALVKIIAYDGVVNAGEGVSDSLFVIWAGTVDAPGDRRRLGDTVLLWQNAPNPFSPGTNISFYLPEEGTVYLEVFDVKGRLVDVLINGDLSGPGVHTVPWNGKDRDGGRLSSGVYFYRFRTENVTLVKKMVMTQ